MCMKSIFYVHFNYSRLSVTGRVPGYGLLWSDSCHWKGQSCLPACLSWLLGWLWCLSRSLVSQMKSPSWQKTRNWREHAAEGRLREWVGRKFDLLFWLQLNTLFSSVVPCSVSHCQFLVNLGSTLFCDGSLKRQETLNTNLFFTIESVSF